MQRGFVARLNQLANCMSEAILAGKATEAVEAAQ